MSNNNKSTVLPLGEALKVGNSKNDKIAKDEVDFQSIQLIQDVKQEQHNQRYKFTIEKQNIDNSDLILVQQVLQSRECKPENKVLIPNTMFSYLSLNFLPGELLERHQLDSLVAVRCLVDNKVRVEHIAVQNRFLKFVFCDTNQLVIRPDEIQIVDLEPKINQLSADETYKQELLDLAKPLSYRLQNGYKVSQLEVCGSDHSARKSLELGLRFNRNYSKQILLFNQNFDQAIYKFAILIWDHNMEAEKLFSHYLSYAQGLFSELTKLGSWFAKFNISDTLFGITYKHITNDKKQIAFQYINRIISELSQPQLQRMKESLDEIQSMFNSIKQQGEGSFKIQELPDNKYLSLFLLFYRHLIPVTTFLLTAIIYLQIIKETIDTVLKKLGQGFNTEDFIDYQYGNIYLHVIRALETMVYNQSIQLIDHLENTVLRMKKDASNSQESIKSDTTLSHAICTRLKNINFSLSQECETGLQTVTLLLSQTPNLNNIVDQQDTFTAYTITTKENISQLIQQLKDQYLFIFVNLFSLPLSYSKYYQYINPSFDNSQFFTVNDFIGTTTKQQSTVMSHFNYGQQAKNSGGLEALLADDQFAVNKNTFMEFYGHAPFIILNDDKLNPELVSEKFNFICQIVSMAVESIKEQLIQMPPTAIIQSWASHQQTQHLFALSQRKAQDVTINNCLLFSKDLMKCNFIELKQFQTKIQKLRDEIQMIPNQFYQYMIVLDLSQFKAQMLNYMDVIRIKMSEQMLKVSRYFASYLVYESNFFRLLFQKQVEPSIISQMNELINIITNQDTLQIFSKLYTIQQDLVVVLLDLGQTNIDIEYFTNSYVEFVFLIKQTQTMSSVVSDYKEMFKKLLNIVEVWFNKEVQKYSKYFLELTLMKIENLNEARTYTSKFRQNFQMVCDNFKFDPMDMQVITQDSLTKQYRDQEKGFYQSFLSVTSMQLYSKRYSYQVLMQDLEIHDQEKGMGSNSLKDPVQMYEKPNARSNEPISITKLFSESIYLAQQFLQVYQFILKWREELGNVDVSYEHVNLEQLLSYVKPLYIVVCYSHYLDSLLKDKCNMSITDLNTSELQEMMDDLCISINFIKAHLNVQNDINSVHNNVQFSFSFIAWKDFIQIVETTILSQVGYIYVLKLVQSDSIQIKHMKILYQFCGLDLRNRKELTIQTIMNKYDENQLILDFLQMINQNAHQDYQATQYLKEISDYFGSIVVDKLAPVKTLLFPILSPRNAREFVFESSFTLTQILNNVGFISNQNENHRILQPELVQYQDILLQSRYSEEIEQQARNLEAQALFLKHIIIMFSCIPAVLSELTTVVQLGSYISNSHQENLVKHKLLDFSMNVLSQADILIIMTCAKQWMEIISKFFHPGQRIVMQCCNLQLMKSIQQIYIQLSTIKEQFNNFQNKSLLNIFKHPLTVSFQTMFEQQTTTNISIIPFVNLKLFPHALLLPQNVFIKYVSFPHMSFYYKYLPSVQELLMPNIEDIILARSATRGQIIVGIKSYYETLEFSEPIICPDRSFLIYDTIIPSIKVALIDQIDEKYPEFQELINNILDEYYENNQDIDNVDDTHITNLYTLVKDNLYVVVFVCLQTIIRNFMFETVGSLKIIQDTDFENVIIFEKINVLYQVFQKLQSMMELGADDFNPMFQKRFTNFTTDYTKLFTKLDDELHFRISTFLKVKEQSKMYGHLDQQVIQQTVQEMKTSRRQSVAHANQVPPDEDKEDEEEQEVLKDLSLTALLGSTTVNFPILFYEPREKKIYVSTTNGNCVTPVGNWWMGAPTNQNSVSKGFSIVLYDKVNQMLQGYNQRLPIFLLSLEHRMLNNQEVFDIIVVFSQFVFKKVVYYQVSEVSFANQLVKIQQLLICGYIVVITGAEYLSGPLQFELSNLARSIRLQSGDLPGIAVPFIDSQVINQYQLTGEIQQPVKVRSGKIEAFKDFGLMIFLVPQMSSILTTEKYVHVPIYENRQDNGGVIQSKMEISQSYVVEVSTGGAVESSQEQSSVGPTAGRKKKTGVTNFTHIQNLNEIGVKLLQTFEFYLTISTELQQPASMYEKTNTSFGKSFYQVACFLKQLGNIAPRLLPADIDYIINNLAEQNVSNVCSSLLSFLLQQMIVFVMPNQDVIELPKIIAGFVSSAFGVCKEDHEQLVQQAQDCFTYKYNILRTLGIHLPNHLALDHQYNYIQYYSKYINQHQKENIVSLQKMLSTLHRLTNLTVSDLSLIRIMLQKYKQCLICCPQINYARLFLSAYTGIYKAQTKYVSSIQELDQYLISNQFAMKPGQKSNQLIVILCQTPQLILEAANVALAFSQPNVYYQTTQGIPFICSDTNQLPSFIVLIDSILIEQIVEFPSLQTFPHTFLLIPFLDQISLAQNYLLNQICFDKQLISSYLDTNSYKSFIKNSEAPYLIDILKYKHQSQMTIIDKYSIHSCAQQWKKYIFDHLTNSFISYCYQVISNQLSLSYTIDETIMLRSMLYVTLFRYGVLELKQKKISQGYKSSDLQEGIDQAVFCIDNYKQMMDDLQTAINCNVQGDDMNGTFYNLNDDCIAKNVQRAFIDSQVTDQARTPNFLQDVFSFSNEEILKRDALLRDMSKQSNISFDVIIEQIWDLLSGAQFLQKGIGASGSLKFQYNFEFLRVHYFGAKNLSTSIQNLFKPIFSAVWTSISLYEKIFVSSGKWEKFYSNSLQKEISESYRNTLHEIKNIKKFAVSGIKNQQLEVMCTLIYLSQQCDLNESRIQSTELQQWQQKYVSNRLTIQRTGSNQDSVYEAATQFFNETNRLLPPQFPDQIFSYLWFNNNNSIVSFIQYEIGTGLLSNVSQKSEQQILEEHVIQQAIVTKEYKKEYDLKIQEFKTKQHKKITEQQQTTVLQGNEDQRDVETAEKQPKFAPPYIQFPDQISIQRLTNQGTTLVIDSHRAALIAQLGMLMTSPLSMIVYGLRTSGKSTCIDIAKLVMRDVVSSQQVFLDHLENVTEVDNLLLASLVNYTIRKNIIMSGNLYDNYITGFDDLSKGIQQSCKQDEMILSYNKASFPLVHINSSESVVVGFDHKIASLVRDHTVIFDSTRQQRYIYKYNGLIQLQDTCIFLELTTQPFVGVAPIPRIEIPPFTEEYFFDLTRNYWPKEKEQWQKQFAKGINLIRSALPSSMTNSYSLFQKMYDAYYLTSNDRTVASFTKDEAEGELVKLFKGSQDQELCRGSIHSLFMALRNRSDVNAQTMVGVAEKLATLSILKYLSNNEAEEPTPWSDATMLIKTSAQLTPSWERFIVQKSLDFANDKLVFSDDSKVDTSEIKMMMKNNISMIRKMFKGRSVLVPSQGNSLFKNVTVVDQQLLVCFRIYSLQSNIMAAMANAFNKAGKGMDPIIVSRVFEAFIILQIQKENIISKVNTIFTNAADDKSSQNLTGLQAVDSYAHIYNALLSIVQKNYSTILKTSNELYQTTYEVDTQEQDNDFENSIDDYQNISKGFFGFSLIDLLSITIPKAILIFENVQSKGYSQAVQVFASIGDYFIINQEGFARQAVEAERNYDEKSDVSSQSGSETSSKISGSQYTTGSSRINLKTQKRYLFELQSLQSILDLDDKRKQSNKQQVLFEKGNPAYFIHGIKKCLQDFQSTERQDFISQFLILRIAFAYALGINPQFVLPQQSGIKERFGLFFPLMQGTPFEVVQNGRRLVSRLPVAVSVGDDFQQQVYHQYGTQDQVDLFDVQYSKLGLDDPLENQQQLMKKYCIEPTQVSIITPKSLLHRKSSENLTLLNYLTYSTESLCNQQGLFSEEELACICVIVSYAYNLPSIVDKHNLVVLLASNLQILIINDQPLVKQYDYSNLFKIRTIGTCKAPIFEIVKNFQVVHNHVLAQEMQSKMEKATTSLAKNSDERIKLNLQTKQNMLTSSATFLKAQHNLIIFQPCQFLQVYKMTGCYLPKEVNLPARISVSWNYQYHAFSLAVLSVFSWCSSQSTQANVSLVHFSALATALCQKILSQCQKYVNQINTLFAAYRYYEVLASPSNTQPSIINLQHLQIQKFIEQIKAVCTNENSFLSSNQLSLSEIIAMRDILHTTIEALKPSFRIINHFARSAVYDSVACLAFVLYDMNGFIQQDSFNELIKSNQLLDNQNTKLDSFSQCIVSVMKQSGLQVTLSKKSEDSKRTVGLLADSQYGMFLNNYLEFVAPDSPVMFVLKINQVPWHPGDYYQKALYSAQLMWDIGINTFICSQDLSLPLSTLLSLLELNQSTNNSYVFSLLYDKIISNQDDIEIKKLHQEAIKNVVSINMTQSFDQICQIIARTLEQSDSMLVFEHCGSPNTLLDNLALLGKLIVMKNRHTMTKKSVTMIGQYSCSLYQALDKYNFIMSLVSGVSYEDFLKDLNLYIQDTYDKICILCQSSDQTTSYSENSKYIVQDLIVSSVFGNNFALRQQQEQVFKFSFQRNYNLQTFILSLRSFLSVQISRIPGVSVQTEDTVDTTLAQLIINITGVQSAIQTQTQYISVISQNLNTHQLSDLFLKIVECLDFEYMKYSNLLQNIKILNDNIILQLQYKEIVESEGNQIASKVSESVTMVTYLINKLGKFHAPFLSYANQDFMNQVQAAIIQGMEEYVRTQHGAAQQALKKEKVTNMEVLIYVVKSDPRAITRQLCQLILPCLLKRIFPLLHIEQAVSYFYLIGIFFLTVLGVTSNLNTDQPLQLSQNNASTNGALIKVVYDTYWQNSDDQIKSLVYLVLSTLINNNYPGQQLTLQKYNNYNQIIPIESCLSENMSITWLKILNLSRYHPLVKDAISWFHVHHSSIAGLAQSERPLDSVVYYFIDQASAGNMLCQQVVKQLDHQGVLSKIIEKLDPSQKEFVQQLPPTLDVPSPSVFLALTMLTYSYKPHLLLENLSIFNIFMGQYFGVTPQDLLVFTSNAEKNQSGLISILPQNKNLIQQLQLLTSMSLAITMEYCNVFYDINTPCPAQLISDAIFSLADVGQRVFRQVEEYQQTLQYEQNNSSLSSPMPVVFIYYDRSMSISFLLNYLLSVQFGDNESKLLKQLEISYTMPQIEDLESVVFINVLDVNTNGSFYARHLTEILSIKKTSNAKSTVMMPIFLLIPSNPISDYITKAPKDGALPLSQSQLDNFAHSITELANISEPHYVYIQTQQRLDKAFSYYFTLAMTSFQWLSLYTRRQLSDREEGILLLQSQSKPSLRGFIILLLKYAILMSKTNVDSNDIDFLNSIRYLVNVSHLNVSTNDQAKEDGEQSSSQKQKATDEDRDNSISVDLSVISTETGIKLDSVDASFLELLDQILKQVINGNQLPLHNFINDFIVETTENSQHLGKDEADEDIEQIKQPMMRNESRDTNHTNDQSVVETSSMQGNEQHSGVQGFATKQDVSAYDKLMNVFNMIKQGNLDMKQFNIQQIENSVQELVFPRNRLIEVKKQSKIEFSIPEKLKDIGSVLQFLGVLSSLSQSNEELFNNNSLYKIPQTLSPVFILQTIRSAFSSNSLEEMMSEFQNSQTIDDQNRAKDLAEMPASLRVFMTSIQQFKTLKFNRYSHYKSPQALGYGLVPDFLLNSLYEKGVYDTSSFVNHQISGGTNFWEISALVYSPLLGDIFNFVMIQQSTQLGFPLQRLRIVITTQKPILQTYINPDGNIIAPRVDGAEEPFYLKLVNFELFGIGYDQKIHSVCDVSPEAKQGFRNFVILYATVAIITEPDEDYEFFLKDKLAGQVQGYRVRIPTGYVPVPLRIGGFIRPFVFLENKTMIPDKEWLQRAPFFGISMI